MSTTFHHLADAINPRCAAGNDVSSPPTFSESSILLEKHVGRGARSAQFRARVRVSHPRTTQAMAPPQGYAPVATTEYEPDSKPAVPQVPVAPAQAQGIPPEQPQVLLGHPVLVRPQGVHKGTSLARFDARILRCGRFARFPRETAGDARAHKKKEHRPRLASRSSSSSHLVDRRARVSISRTRRRGRTHLSVRPVFFGLCACVILGVCVREYECGEV